jgi:Caspase domain
VDGRRKALIVANDRYEHDGLRHLLSPGADAEALGRVLGDPQIGGFEVRVVRNEPAHVIGTYIEDLFSDSRPDDVLLLHFSCHGLKSESGELFFAASNTRPNRLGSTAVSADFVQRCMRASRSRSIVLLLDCCYGGAFSRGVRVRASGDANVLDSFPGGELGGGRGRAVITASSAMEYAFEGDLLADETARPPSVFTSTLVEGMATGEADRDEDGWISLNELYDYVFDRVREKNPNQTPSRDVEMQGELYVARSRRRRVRPQPIPADLRAAMTHENMFSRLGAVTELRSRLTSDQLPVAAGACEALKEIAGTDIRYVADAATAALEEATIRPSERELHFGEVAVGADAGVRAVRLLGPPLARACTVQPTESWITVTDTAEGVAVSVATSRPGTHRGSLTVRGPTGEVLIPVDVQVTEPSPEPPPGGQAVAPAAVIATPEDAAPGPSESTRPVTAATSTPADAPAAPQVASPPLAQAPPASGPAPTAPPATDRRSPWPGRVAIAMLTAGGLTVLLGLILPTIEGDADKIGTIAIQIVVYGAVWALLASTPGEATLGRRIILAVLGASALVVVVVLVATSPEYLEYWKIRETPLFLFWLIAGALEIGAALLGGARPTRRLELVSGTLSAILGVLIIYIVNQQSSGLVVAFSLYFVALGAVWVLIGLVRRRAVRAG